MPTSTPFIPGGPFGHTYIPLFRVVRGSITWGLAAAGVGEAVIKTCRLRCCRWRNRAAQAARSKLQHASCGRRTPRTQAVRGRRPVCVPQDQRFPGPTSHKSRSRCCPGSVPKLQCRALVSSSEPALSKQLSATRVVSPYGLMGVTIVFAQQTIDVHAAGTVLA